MTIARIVLFGDTHLGFDLPANPRVDRRRRGEDFFQNYERVLAYIARGRPDAVVHSGDFFFRSRVAPAIVERAFAALAAIAEAGTPVMVVPGNHDRSRLPPSLWLGQRNLHVFDRPRTVTVTARGITLAFAGFPFARGDLRATFRGLLGQARMESAEAGARFLCMHHTVAGASVGPNGYTFRSGPDVVPAAALPASFAAVLGGHIHRHQVLRHPGRPAVFYPGSTERTSFAEREETKGFLELEVEQGSRGAVKVSHEFHVLPSRPMVDVVLPGSLQGDGVATYLAEAVQRLPADAVVRVGAEDPSPGLAEGLRAATLRAVFPPTMNVQLARGLFGAFE